MHSELGPGPRADFGCRRSANATGCGCGNSSRTGPGSRDRGLSDDGGGKLPHWALPKGNNTGKPHPAAGSRPPALQRGPIDQKTTVRIEGFRRILGDPIYGEIIWRVAHARQANAIPNAQLQANVAEAMERASRGFSKAHSLAEQIGETSFIAILDRLRIESMTTIPRLEMLKTLVAELEREAARTAA